MALQAKVAKRTIVMIQEIAEELFIGKIRLCTNDNFWYVMYCLNPSF